jgi:hypothetical protein
MEASLAHKAGFAPHLVGEALAFFFNPSKLIA